MPIRSRRKNDPLTSFKNFIRGNSNPRFALSNRRGALPPSYYHAALTWLRSLRSGGYPIVTPASPHHLAEIQRLRALSPVDALQELSWFHATIAPHAAAITKFVAIKQALPRLILESRYDEALTLLDEVASNFGFSLWYIHKRIALLQTHSGPNAQRQWVEHLKDQCKTGDSLAFIIAYYGQRSEDSTVASIYTKRLASHIGLQAVAPDLKLHLNYHLLHTLPQKPDELLTLLRVEECSDLIDYYETFIAIAQHAVAQNLTQLTTPFAQVLPSLSVAITDPRLNKLTAISCGDTSWLDTVPLRDIVPDNALIMGNYELALETSQRRIIAKPDDTGAWFVYASCPEAPSTWAGSQSVVQTLRAECTAIAQERDEFHEAVADLAKLRLVLADMPFFAAIDKFYMQEAGSEPILNDAAAMLAFLRSPYLEIDWCQGTADVEIFSRYLAERYGASEPTIVYQLIRNHATPSGKAAGSNLWTLLLDLEMYYRGGAFEDVLTGLSGLPKEPRWRRYSNRLSAWCLLQLAREAEAIDLIAAWGILQPKAMLAMPITKAARLLCNEDLRLRLASKLSTPILLDIYAKHVASNLESLRHFAYEDLLAAQGIDRPSQLRGYSERFDRAQLIYYLRYVCVPEVMAPSHAFEKLEQVFDERFAICALLSELDPDNQSAYAEEAGEIKRAGMIRRAIRVADQSKISIDVPAIRRWAENSVADTYARYQSARSITRDDSEKILREAFVESLATRTLPAVLSDVPNTEAYRLLTQAADDVVGELMTGSQYGLEAFLSIKVRHGTLTGQLRQPVQDYQLVTQRAAGSLSYQSNTAWLNQFGGMEEGKLRRLDKAFSTFSQQYDELIEDLRTQRIQIAGGSTPHGLFTYTLDTVDVHALYEATGPGVPFERFFDACLAIFWTKADRSLARVRDYLETEVKQRLRQLFETLVTAVDGTGLGPIVSNLRSAVLNASADTLRVVDRIRDWFRVVESIEAFEMTARDLITVALQVVTSFHRAFSPVLSVVAPDVPLAGTFMSDALLILFDNVRKHSGMDCPRLNVTVSYDNGILTTAVANELADRNSTLNKTQIEKSRSDISSGRYRSGVSREGGSGLNKLANLIELSGLDPREHLVFHLKEPNEFVVTFDVIATKVALDDRTDSRG